MIKKILTLIILCVSFCVNAQTFQVNTLQVNTAFTATGLVGLTNLAHQAGNTVIGNATGSSASPTAFAMPSCSTSSSALQWTSGTGPVCNSSINAASLGGNLASAFALLASPAFTGTPTAPTQAHGDGNNYLATDNFVQQEGNHYNQLGGINFSTNTTLTVSQFGGWGVINATGVGLTLPAVSTTKTGQIFTVIGYASGVINTNGTDSLCSPTGAVCGTTYAVNKGDVVNIISNGTIWYATNGIATQTNFIPFGTSLKPLTTPGQISTTATSTINTNTITVTSASGLAVNMGIYASFVAPCSTAVAAFVNPYITNIAGTTITMSCNATATNSSPVAVNFGQPRWDTNSIITANDIGTQTLKVGRAAGNGSGDVTGNTATWLDEVSTGQDFRLTSAAQILTPPGGGYALTLGSRTSDATGGGTAFPLQSILYMDSWGNTSYQPENVYLQDNLGTGTAGHSQPHIQMEQSMNSTWSTVGEDPYSINQLNQTISHRVDCGTGQQSAPFPNNCTAAYEIVPNGAKFENGIVISNGAIDQSGGTGNGLSLPLADQIIWYSAASTYSSSIQSPTAGIMEFDVPSGGAYRFRQNGTLVFGIVRPLSSGAAPTIASGFGTGSSISASNGTNAFNVTVGSSPGSSGVLTMPITATDGWMCDGVDLSNINATQFYLRETAYTTTSVTMTMYNTSGASANFVAGDLLAIKCSGF